MPSKSIQMKSIHFKFTFTFFILLFSTGIVLAQEIIKENAVDTIKKVNSSKKQKIDGIIAKVGDYIILDSDIDKSYLEISSQGGSVKDITRCQILGKIMEDKLYAHHPLKV